MAFCNAMKNFTLNEKGNITNSLEGSAGECLGLVNLYHNAIGKRGGGMGGKGGKGGMGGKGGKGHCTNDFDENKINNMVDFIYKNIDNLDTFEEKKTYLSYFVKLVFHIRDHKDGNGERLLAFKLILRLYEKLPGFVTASLPLLTGGYNHNSSKENIEEDNDKPFGGFLDLNKLYDLCTNKHENLKNAIVSYYIKCIMIDKYATAPSLAVKWIPRENKCYDRLAKTIANTIFIDNEPLYKKMEKYRKLIGGIMKKITVLETLMAKGLWDEIEVKDIPSKSLIKYLYALKNEDKKTGAIRHPDDEKRMILRNKILCERDKSPEQSRINVSVLQPYEIVREVLNNDISEEQEKDIITMWDKFVFEWNNTFTENSNYVSDMVIMADVSASMSGIPMEACIALALLFSEKLNGCWKNKVLTFDSNPVWHNIPEHLNIVEKIRFLQKAPWGGSTNIGLALDKILENAISNNVNQDEMPSKLLILSDMQFDQACRPGDNFLTGFEFLESKYKRHGYKMPHIVFWNLRANTNGYANKTNQKGTAMLSGFGASSFKAILSGDFNINSTPWSILKDILDSTRLKKLDPILNMYINPFQI